MPDSGNTLITPQIVAREAVMQLSNRLVMIPTVYRDYSNEFAAGVGDVINVRVPATMVVNDSVGNSAQSVTEQKVPIKMSQFRSVKFAIGSKEQAMTLQNFNQQFIEPATQALSNDMDAFVARLMYSACPYMTVESAGTVKIDDLSTVAANMTIRKVPTDNRHLILDPLSAAKYKVLPPILDASQRGSNSVIANNIMGNILGFDSYETQNIQTMGTLVGSLSGCTTPAAVDLGAESMLISDADATPGLIPAGTPFEIAGDATKYVVTEDVLQTATGCSIKFSPPLRVSIISAKAITIGSPTGSGKTQSLAYHTNAFAFVTRPLGDALGAVRSEVVALSNGISCRITYAWDDTNRQTIVTLEVLYGGRVLLPDAIERVVGQ